MISKHEHEHITPSLRHLAVELSELAHDPANVRKHDARNIEAIRASLARFGQRKPIVVQAQGRIVRAGNGTLEAARALKWTHLAAVIIDEDHVSAAAFAIADNRTAELASWDVDALASTLAQLDIEGVALDELGWTDADLEDLAQMSDIDTDSESDDAEDVDGLSFKVVVLVDDESAQRQLVARLEAEGFECQPLML